MKFFFWGGGEDSKHLWGMSRPGGKLKPAQDFYGKSLGHSGGELEIWIETCTRVPLLVINFHVRGELFPSMSWIIINHSSIQPNRHNIGAGHKARASSAHFPH